MVIIYTILQLSLNQWYMNHGLALKKLIKQKGLNVDEFADLYGVSRNSVYATYFKKKKFDDMTLSKMCNVVKPFSFLKSSKVNFSSIGLSVFDANIGKKLSRVLFIPRQKKCKPQNGLPLIT